MPYKHRYLMIDATAYRNSGTCAHSMVNDI